MRVGIEEAETEHGPGASIYNNKVLWNVHIAPVKDEQLRWRTYGYSGMNGHAAVAGLDGGTG